MDFEAKISELLSLRSADYRKFVSNLLELIRGPSTLQDITAIPVHRLKTLYDLLDIIQAEADEEPEHGAELETFLLRVSSKTGYLPASLLLKNVEHNQVAVAGGLSCDIYRGQLTTTTTSQAIALKVLRPYSMKENPDKMRKDFRREALQWRQLRHPNIYPFLGLWDKMAGDRMCLISPWSSYGDLTKFLDEHPNHDRLRLARDVAEGLQYLHGRQPPLVHGDLKGANILIDSQTRACISDFGISKFLQDHGTTTVTTHSKGTLRWMAPEQLKGGDPSKARSTASDVYSLSHVFVEIYTGEYPWPDLPQDIAVISKFVAGERPTRPDGIPDTIWAIIESCREDAPADRMSASKIASALAGYKARLYLEPLSALSNSGIGGELLGLSPEMHAVEKILDCLPKLLTTLDSLTLADQACTEAVLRRKEEILGSVQSLGRRPGPYDPVPSSGSGSGSSPELLRINTRATQETTRSIEQEDPAPSTVFPARSPADATSLPDSAAFNLNGLNAPTRFARSSTSLPNFPSIPMPSPTPCLPYLNQVAQQKRASIDWPGEKTGPDHAPTWQVRCVVNGTVRGTGFGALKQSAKEQAAREALDSLGWGQPGSASRSPSITNQFTASPVQSPAAIRPQSMQALPGIAALQPALPGGKSFLSFFKEEADRRHLVVDYSQIGRDSEIGPLNPNWSFKVIVGGEEQGAGTGPSKQAAKEAAARDAYRNMRWDSNG
ncbi:kinase-like protein [Heliocybe sulcata]|uniref:Kinase-like protein n=1 Tax=Heliocybe sulcata TaxID=5364 RepID=A0A5C3NH73_9AGAM|nr:kinase-like protein [Heliocybe sulcata]